MRYFLTALGGAMIGAGAALLMAPQSGRATRSFLRQKATKVKNNVQDFTQGKAKHLQNKMKGYQHQANEVLESGKEMLNMGTGSQPASDFDRPRMGEMGQGA